MAIKSSNIETKCAKQAWVVDVLSSSEAIDGQAMDAELEQHLAKCDSCQALSRRVGPVAVGLAGLAMLGPSSKLLGKATAQASHALQTGGQFTGRIDVPVGSDGALTHALPWTKIYVFGVVTVVIAVFIAIWLSEHNQRQQHIEPLEHQATTKKVAAFMDDPWSAFGSRSVKEIDRAADIEPLNNQRATTTNKKGHSPSKPTDSKRSGSAISPPE